MANRTYSYPPAGSSAVRGRERRDGKLTTASDSAPGGFESDLQRTIGNRGTAALLQRVSQAKELSKEKDAAKTATSLVGLSVPDLLDTVFDPAFAKGNPSAPIIVALRTQGPAGAPAVAAMRAGSGPYDENFYYSLGLLEPVFRGQLWDHLAKSKPKVANPTARSGVISAAFAGFCQAKAYEDALGMIAKYNFDDILDVITMAHAGGLLAELEKNWGAAKGIDVGRVRAAVSGVRLAGLFNYLNITDVPVGDVMAKAQKGQLDTLEKELDKAIADPKSPAAWKERNQRTKAILGPARASIDTLAKDSVGLSKPDLESLNRFLGAQAGSAFNRVIGDKAANRQGQFVLSSAVSGAVWAVINDYAAKLNGLAPDVLAKLQSAYDGLTAASNGVDPAQARVSYVNVDNAVRKFRAALTVASKSKGIPIPADVVGVLKAALPVPPQKTSYADVLGAVWAPMWQQWLKTKTFPDITGARNFYKLAYLRMADLWACQPMAMKLAELYDAKATGGEVRAKEPKFAFGSVQLYSGTKMVKDPGSGETSETVLYRSDLGERVEQMRQALDHGWFVHVRVMSGVKMDYTTSRAAAEHSLLVVGHRGNTFLCSDTDPGGEGAVHLQTGYAGLFFDPVANTLASGVGGGLAVGGDGMQANNRHRYQAWTMNTK